MDDAQERMGARWLPRWVFAVPSNDAARRVAAWIYGTVLALAALAVVSPEMADDGGGAALLLGVGIGTFVAHLFADTLGEEVRSRRSLTRAERRELWHDTLPVLTGMTPPALLLWLGTWNSISGSWMLFAALAVTLLRLPVVGLIIAVRTGRRPVGAMLVVGGAGVVVVAIKVIVSH